MTEKFCDTIIFKNLDCYSKSMRVNIELLLIFNLIKYFQYKKILEIGFFEGKTFSTILESIKSTGELTAVDPFINRTIFDKLYGNCEIVSNNKITFLPIKSENFKSQLNYYDFINVDGDHSIPVVLKDLQLAFKMIKIDGIVMIDDYALDDVDYAIEQCIKLNTDFVPFLMCEQSVFFHHVSHDAASFLDNEISNLFSMFCDVSNVEYKNYHVKKISCLPAITNNDDIFSLVCERYKL